MSEKVLISKDGLRQALGLKGLLGKCAAGALYSVLGIGKLNREYPGVAGLTGPDFSEEVLRRFGISYKIPREQFGNIPSEGGFLTVSNHPFGGADGLILNAIIGSRRKDFKILTTFLLAQVRNLADWFIPVDNFSTGGARSVAGIREALGHIDSGGALGLFPAGEVSTWQKKGVRTAVSGKRVVEDKPWAANIIKLVRNSGLPVVPVYFDGGNSRLFHVLGRVHPALRTIRLVRELTGKKGTVVKVRIGRPIPASEVANMDIPTLRDYLRNRCYALEAECVPRKRDSFLATMSPLADPADPEVIRSHMGQLEDKVVFQTGDYQGYLLEESDAPEVMRELYRLREETFRAVGEGTGNPEDTDPYDSYYKHLILWNIPKGEIAGAYRVGYGSQIVPRMGKAGLYTDSLITYGPAADTLLPHCMELGRSFVSLKFQKEVLPLKLMLSGLTVALARDPESTFCTGAVSMSDSLPDLYKSLVVYFLERDFSLPDARMFARPTHPFKPDFLRVDPEGLLTRVPRGDIDALDKLLYSMSDGKYRLPVLLRKYFSCGAKVSCMNVDPLFHDSLDAIIVLKAGDFPVPMLRSIARPLSKEAREVVFNHFYGTTDPE